MKRLGWLGRIPAVLVGAAMLALIAARRNPWEMTRFAVEDGAIHVRLFATTFLLPTWWTLYGALGAVLITWLVVAWRKRPGWVSTVLGMLLVFSLAPIKPGGAGVVLNLLLGGLGTVLLAFGLAHLRVTAGAEALCRWAHLSLPTATSQSRSGGRPELPGADCSVARRVGKSDEARTGPIPFKSG